MRSGQKLRRGDRLERRRGENEILRVEIYSLTPSKSGFVEATDCKKAKFYKSKFSTKKTDRTHNEDGGV